MAAGDYTNSPTLISRFKGERFSGVEGINPRSTGDGHLMCESVGAQLVNMDITYGPELRFVAPLGKRTFQQLLPSRGPLLGLAGKILPMMPKSIMSGLIRRLLVTWQHPEDALFDDGAILLNNRGERFCDERVPVERELAIADQPDKQCYILLDEPLQVRYSEWPNFISTAPKIAYAYVQDYLRLRPDVAVRGSLEQVARRRQLPLDSIQQAVENVNVERGDVGVLPTWKAKTGPCSVRRRLTSPPLKAVWPSMSSSERSTRRISRSRGCMRSGRMVWVGRSSGGTGCTSPGR